MKVRVGILWLLAVLVAAPALGQGGGYPNKPMRWVIPFAPGGGTDVVARPIAQKFSERVGQPVTYDNRGGAGGVIAGEIVAKASPDGYTLLVAAVAVMTVNPTLMKMPFDPVKDFVPITKFASVPNMLCVRAAFPSRTLAELIAHAKSNPGKVTFAQSGTGSGGHLATEMLKMVAGVDVVPVFYKGAGPATISLISNESDGLFANPGVFMPHIKAGRLRPLAVAAAQRIALFPELPTFLEAGHQGMDFSSWYGLAAPAGTPQAIIRYLHKEVVAVLNQPDILARLALDGATPVGNTPEAFAKENRDDIARFAKIIKAANIKM